MVYMERYQRKRHFRKFRELRHSYTMRRIFTYIYTKCIHIFVHGCTYLCSFLKYVEQIIIFDRSYPYIIFPTNIKKPGGPRSILADSCCAGRFGTRTPSFSFAILCKTERLSETPYHHRM